MKALLVLPLVALLAIVSVGVSCSSGTYHTLVTVERDYDTAVKAYQNTIEAEFAAGNLDQATRATLEGVALKLGQSGEQVNTLLQQNASKQTVAAQISNIDQLLQSTISDGLAGVKNATTKQEITVGLQTVDAIVKNFSTELGGAK